MIVPIILYGSSVLRKRSVEVTPDDNIREMGELLLDTVKKADGIGLAAPQINLLKRIIVIDTSPIIEESDEKYESVLINPEIVDYEDDLTIYKEGCLSFPGIFEEIYRPDTIYVKYQDLSFNIHEEKLNGIKSRIFQHEFDHLNGILFIDKMEIIKRNLLRGKLNRIRKASLLQKI